MGEIVAYILGELVVQAVCEILLEAGWLTVRASAARQDEVPAIVSWAGLLLIGAALGGISVYVWPERVTRPSRFRGASLILSPLLNGLALDTYGRWRRGRGGPASHASTFWGGAFFAFGIALIRFWFVPAFPDLPFER